MNPLNQLVHATVRIECFDDHGNGSSGTGFFFAFCKDGDEHVPCVVTNKHVVRGARVGQFHLTAKASSGGPDLGNHVPIRLNDFESMWIFHPDPAIDLAVFPIGPILHQARSQGLDFFYTWLDSNIIPGEDFLHKLSVMEEIVMIGYPNGIWDSVHNLPILRRGTTATHPRLKYNGKPEFMIDAACFPGSSGSPVFIANIGHYVSEDGGLVAGSRLGLLGVLYAGPQHTAEGEIRIVPVPTDTKPVALSRIPNNLGLVISASKVIEFDSLLRQKLKPNA